MKGDLRRIIEMGNDYFPIPPVSVIRKFHESGVHYVPDIQTEEEVKYLVEIMGVNIEEILERVVKANRLSIKVLKIILYQYNANVNATIRFWLNRFASQEVNELLLNH